MNTENNLDENKNGYSQEIQGKIIFNNVSFAYTGLEKAPREAELLAQRVKLQHVI